MITRLEMMPQSTGHVRRLTIHSPVGVTNEIQHNSLLSGSNWGVLTNVVVSISPYLVEHTAAHVNALGFYRVLLIGAPTNSPAPSGMAYIPAGAFTMGDVMGDAATYGWAWELPAHSVYVSSFYVDTNEVTLGLWNEVRLWNGGNGYSYENGGRGKATNHPVDSVSWFDMVKWCNARSEKEGLTPAYYTDATLTVVYRTGVVANPCVNWNASGYRLPTEAEWEKAARGGTPGHRYPWSDTDTINHNRANYYSAWVDGHPYYPFDVNSTEGYHPIYNVLPLPNTSPVGSFPPNAYGLYDVAGNLWEWCWDWWSDTYYQSSPGVNPRGPDTGLERVQRGGRTGSAANNCRTAARGYRDPSGGGSLGFRSVRSADH